MKYIYYIGLALALGIGGCDSDPALECEGADCGATSADNNDDATVEPDGSDVTDIGTDNDAGSNAEEGNAGDEVSDSGNGSDAGTSDEEPSGSDDGVAETPDEDEAPGESPQVPVVSGLSLDHRHGQTFITWDEPLSHARYHVYRSSQPITSANLADATPLTGRWGSLDADTSRNSYAVTDVPQYFVIDDLGAPLSDSTGLFVHTATKDETAYYVITSIIDGVENRTVIAGQNSGEIQESVATPRPVLVMSVNGGKGRLYTHYMDYQRWNPTLNGYAFSYFVALPFDYDSSRSYPLQVELHAYGNYPSLLEEVRYLWQVIQLMPIDPGDNFGTSHTWWYGHARDHDYLANGSVPSAGVIENFTQQRLMKSIQEVIDDPDINIDTDLIHAYGNSMGASGSVSLAMHYAGVFSGIYASQPMMNYATSSRFRYNFERLFGTVDDNLPIVNRGLYSENIQRYGQGGGQPTGVWDWMNHHAQVQRRRGDDLAYMMIDFGKADDVIDWQTQGRPTFSAFSDARVAFTATAREGVGHEWRAFDAVNNNLFALRHWRYPNSLSYPAFNFASGSGRTDPPSSGDDEYQTTLEWSTPQYGFGQSPVDQGNRYELTVRSTASEQRVDITPRNTQFFRPVAGEQCDWLVQNVNNNASESGAVVVDGSGLVTIPQVNVVTAGGSRLIVECF